MCGLILVRESSVVVFFPTPSPALPCEHGRDREVNKPARLLIKLTKT